MNDPESRALSQQVEPSLSAAGEREQIVEWLRGQAAIYNDQNPDLAALPEWTLAQKWANAIECGEHLSTPQPAPEAEVRSEARLQAGTSALADDLIEAQSARLAELEHAIDRDRYVVAAALGSIRTAIRGHSWLMDGRGPYEWDDDRYREEFGDAISNIEKALEPLVLVAWDKSDCTRIAERVDAARKAAQALVAGPIRHREILAADLGLPCPACKSLQQISDPTAGKGEDNAI